MNRIKLESPLVEVSRAAVCTYARLCQGFYLIIPVTAQLIEYKGWKFYIDKSEGKYRAHEYTTSMGISGGDSKTIAGCLSLVKKTLDQHLSQKNFHLERGRVKVSNLQQFPVWLLLDVLSKIGV